MNKKNLTLIACILASIVFVNLLFVTEPQEMFGFPVNIWVKRLGWLAIAVSNYAFHTKIKKSEKALNQE